MATHDRYDTDILKQLTRIANSLEKIERKLPEPEQPTLTANEMREEIGLEPVECEETKTCYNCRYRDIPGFMTNCPCVLCGTDHLMWEEKIDEQNN